MARYFVLGNVLFTEIEQQEFIELLMYGRPQLKNRMIGADQMKKKAKGVIDESEDWLAGYIAVVATRSKRLDADVGAGIRAGEDGISDGCLDLDERPRIPVARCQLDNQGLESGGVRR